MTVLSNLTMYFLELQKALHFDVCKRHEKRIVLLLVENVNLQISTKIDQQQHSPGQEKANLIYHVMYSSGNQSLWAAL